MTGTGGQLDRNAKAPGDAAGPDGAAEVWALLCDLVLDNERRQQVSDALGLTFGRIRALRRIAALPKPMGELAATLGIDAPYMTIVVDDLEAKGLVERRPHPTDRRAKLVMATRRGKDAARRAEAILSTPPTQLTDLDGTDLSELGRILQRVADGKAGGGA